MMSVAAFATACKELISISKNIEDFEEALTEFQTLHEDYLKQIETYKKDIEKYNKQLTEKNEEIANLRQILLTRNKTIEDLQIKNNLLRQRLKQKCCVS